MEDIIPKKDKMNMHGLSAAQTMPCKRSPLLYHSDPGSQELGFYGGPQSTRSSAHHRHLNNNILSGLEKPLLPFKSCLGWKQQNMKRFNAAMIFTSFVLIRYIIDSMSRLVGRSAIEDAILSTLTEERSDLALQSPPWPPVTT